MEKSLKILLVLILGFICCTNAKHFSKEQRLPLSDEKPMLSIDQMVEEERRGLFARIFLAFLFMVCGLSGTFGNALVMFVIWKDPSLQVKNQLSNMSIFNLALTDLISSFFGAIPAAVNVVYDYQVSHKLLCYFLFWLHIGCMAATYETIFVITIDRVIAVKWSLHYPQWVTQSRMLYVLIFVWIHSLSVSGSFVAHGDSWLLFDYWSGICDMDWTGNSVVQVHTIIHGTYIVLIPSMIIVAGNVAIVYMSRDKGRVGTIQSESEAKGNNRILAAMMILTLFFVCLNVPVAGTRIFKTAFPHILFPNWLNSAAQVSQFLASVVNPFIYGFLRKDFQNAFKKIGKQILVLVKLR